MNIFISSPNLDFDKNSDLISLEYSNLDDVQDSDIIIGTASFMDELFLKAILNNGVFPFLITLSNSSSIAPLFRHLTLTLEINSFILTNELLHEIIKIRETLIKLESHIRENEEEEIDISLLEKLLLNYLSKETYLLSSGLKSTEKEKPEDKELNSITIHIKENKTTAKKTIYVFLRNDKYLKIFSKMVDIDFSVNDRAIENYFGDEFERLMKEENSEDCNSFKDITLNYATKFLLLEKGVTQYYLLDVAPTVDFSLKLYRDVNLKEVVVYPMVERKKKIDGLAIELLSSISKYFYHNDIGMIGDFRPILMSRNLYDSYRNKDRYLNIIADVFEKFIDKIEKAKGKDKLSNFDLSIKLLKSDFKNIEKNKNVLTNIFYDIESGINVNRMIKKQFDGYMSNLTVYKKSLKEAEKLIENEHACPHILDFIEESTLDERVHDIVYIYNILKCLDDKSKLKKRVTNLYDKLVELNLPTSMDFSNGYKLDPYDQQSFEEYQLLEKNDIDKNFIRAMAGSMFRMKSKHLNIKKTSKLMGYIVHILSSDDKKERVCFMAFTNIYADRQSENRFLLALYDYLKSDKREIREYFQKIDIYTCQPIINSIEVTTKYGVESILKKTLERRKDRLNDALKDIANFYELFSPKVNIEEIVEKITQDKIESNCYCQEQITIDFLKTFLKKSNICEQSLANFFECFKKEYKGEF